MLNRLYTTGLILTAMLILSGCGASLGSGNSGGGSTGYLGGTQGLDLRFMNSAPPDYIYDNTQFDYDVQVKLENMGEIDLLSGQYTVDLIGVDLGLFGLSAAATQGSADLEGRYLDPEGNTIPGGINYWTWSSQGYSGTVTGNTPYTIWAEACYVYGSEAQAFLCYKSDDLLDTDAEAVCKTRETKPVQNAGSPIQITRLSESAMGSNKISFTFDITHSGNGQLYANTGQGPTCTDELQYENGVFVEVTTGNTGSSLDCSFPDGGTTSGNIQLYDGKFTVRCTENVPANSNWESLVTIRTKYDYKQKISKQLIVKASE